VDSHLLDPSETLAQQHARAQQRLALLGVLLNRCG